MTKESGGSPQQPEQNEERSDADIVGEAYQGWRKGLETTKGTPDAKHFRAILEENGLMPLMSGVMKNVAILEEELIHFQGDQPELSRIDKENIQLFKELAGLGKSFFEELLEEMGSLKQEKGQLVSRERIGSYLNEVNSRIVVLTKAIKLLWPELSEWEDKRIRHRKGIEKRYVKSFFFALAYPPTVPVQKRRKQGRKRTWRPDLLEDFEGEKDQAKTMVSRFSRERKKGEISDMGGHQDILARISTLHENHEELADEKLQELVAMLMEDDFLRGHIREDWSKTGWWRARLVQKMPWQKIREWYLKSNPETIVLYSGLEKIDALLERLGSDSEYYSGNFEEIRGVAKEIIENGIEEILSGRGNLWLFVDTILPRVYKLVELERKNQLPTFESGSTGKEDSSQIKAEMMKGLIELKRDGVEQIHLVSDVSKKGKELAMMLLEDTHGDHYDWALIAPSEEINLEEGAEGQELIDRKLHSLRGRTDDAYDSSRRALAYYRARESYGFDESLLEGLESEITGDFIGLFSSCFQECLKPIEDEEIKRRINTIMEGFLNSESRGIDHKRRVLLAAYVWAADMRMKPLSQLVDSTEDKALLRRGLQTSLNEWSSRLGIVRSRDRRLTFDADVIKILKEDVKVIEKLLAPYEVKSRGREIIHIINEGVKLGDWVPQELWQEIEATFSDTE